MELSSNDALFHNRWNRLQVAYKWDFQLLKPELVLVSGDGGKNWRELFVKYFLGGENNHALTLIDPYSNKPKVISASRQGDEFIYGTRYLLKRDYGSTGTTLSCITRLGPDETQKIARLTAKW